MSAFAGLYVQESSVQRCGRGSSLRSASRRVETAAFSRAAQDPSRPLSPPPRRRSSQDTARAPAKAQAEHPFWKTTRALKSSVSTMISSLPKFHFGNFVTYSPIRLSLSATSATTLVHSLDQQVLQKEKQQQPRQPEQQQPVQQQQPEAEVCNTTGSSVRGSASKEASPSKRKSSLEGFLKRADYLEVQYTSMLADLSNMAYEVGKVNPDLLQEHHNLTVIATSASCPLPPANTKHTTPSQYPSARATSGSQATLPSSHMAPLASAPRDHHNATLADTVLVGLDPEQQNPNALLSLSLSAAAIDPAASHMALSHLSETGPAIPMVLPAEYANHPEEYAKAIHCPVVSLATLNEERAWLDEYLASPAALPPLHPVPLTNPNLAQGFSPELPTAMPVPTGSFLEAAADALKTCSVNPEPLTDWFACDDPVTQIRYFSIKGSDSKQHWQINLRFEAVVFESPELGVQVHSGVYEAALKMYDDLLPLVRQHVATSPFATVCFTGHSLGGSLASVLMLLMVLRGELPQESLSPCYTFGAPAVFCGGAADHASLDHCAGGFNSSGSSQPHGVGASLSSSSLDCIGARHSGLLTRLGLSEDLLVNVIMHKDIVPRVFVADYTIVAALLKAWMPSFKGHTTLQRSHKHKLLYNFIGRVALLRPDDDAPFVLNDAEHDMLPAAPGLYKLYEPVKTPQSNSLGASCSLDGVSSRHYASGFGNPGASLASSDSLDLEVHALSGSFTLSPDGSWSPSKRSSSFDGAAAAPKVDTPAPHAPPTANSTAPAVGTVGTAPTVGKVSTANSTAPAVVGTLDGALLQFMNHPHPLAMLVKSSSYGGNGAISRYHNPESYLTGLVRVAQLKSSGLQSRTCPRKNIA